MSRPPSDKTRLKQCRSEILDLKRTLSGVYRERDEYRARATKAEQACADWQRRFDLLLTRDSQQEGKKP